MSPAAQAGTKVERAGAPAMPLERMQTSGYSLGPAPSEGMTQRQKIAWFHVVRKVTVCVSAIGAFVIGNGFWIAKLRKAGGVWKAAKRVVTAKGKRAKLAVLGGIFGNVLGIDQIAEKC